MKAITVEPGKPGTVRYEDIPEPDVREGSILVEAIAAAVCGTDIEIAEGKYGWAPPGKTRLVLGHESLGRVIDPGPSSSFKKGDLVSGIVRRPDPVPCPNCAVGECGHVPQRPVHRAGDQRNPRIHVGTLAHRTRIRHQGGPFPGNPRRASRADDGDHKSAGAGPRGGPTLLLGTEDRAGDRRGTDRSFGGRCSESDRNRGPCPRSCRNRTEAGTRARPRRDVSLRERSGSRIRAGRHRRVYGCLDR